MDMIAPSENNTATHQDTSHHAKTVHMRPMFFRTSASLVGGEGAASGGTTRRCLPVADIERYETSGADMSLLFTFPVVSAAPFVPTRRCDLVRAQSLGGILLPLVPDVIAHACRVEEWQRFGDHVFSGFQVRLCRERCILR